MGGYTAIPKLLALLDPRSGFTATRSASVLQDSVHVLAQGVEVGEGGVDDAGTAVGHLDLENDEVLDVLEQLGLLDQAVQNLGLVEVRVLTHRHLGEPGLAATLAGEVGYPGAHKCHDSLHVRL